MFNGKYNQHAMPHLSDGLSFKELEYKVEKMQKLIALLTLANPELQLQGQVKELLPHYPALDACDVYPNIGDMIENKPAATTSTIDKTYTSGAKYSPSEVMVKNISFDDPKKSQTAQNVQRRRLHFSDELTNCKIQQTEPSAPNVVKNIPKKAQTAQNVQRRRFHFSDELTNCKIQQTEPSAPNMVKNIPKKAQTAQNVQRRRLHFCDELTNCKVEQTEPSAPNIGDFEIFPAISKKPLKSKKPKPVAGNIPDEIAKSKKIVQKDGKFENSEIGPVFVMAKQKTDRCTKDKKLIPINRPAYSEIAAMAYEY